MAESNEESKYLQTGGLSCLIRRNIADAVTNWPFENYREGVLLGDWESFLHRVDCETCQQVVRYFESQRSIDFRSLSPSCTVVLQRIYDYFYISCVGFFYTIASSLLSTKQKYSLPEGKKGRIDHRQLKQWLANCEANRSEVCHQRLK
jgi:hypothetical protein